MRLMAPNWSRLNMTTNFFDEMDRFLKEYDNGTKLYDERTFDPACDVSESEESYLLSFDLPGMSKDDIKIEMVDRTLSVSGERKRETSTEDKEKVQRFERSYGFFKRAFTLPTTVDSEKIAAHYQDGVLKVLVPKSAAIKPRQIEVQSGKSGFFDKILGSKEPQRAS